MTAKQRYGQYAPDGALYVCATTGTGTLSTPVTLISAPINTVPPVISGTASSGSTLTSTTGTWTGTATITYSYQWYRGISIGGNEPVKDGGDNYVGNAISGATSSTYVLTEDDVDYYIFCKVRASNTQGEGFRTSNLKGLVILTVSPPSPLEIFGSDLVAWWDFSDETTMTQSGGKVDTVTDKANGIVLTGLTDTRPTYMGPGVQKSAVPGQFDEIGAVVFDGGDFLISDSFDGGFGTELAAFVHCNMHDDTDPGNAALTLAHRIMSYVADSASADHDNTESAVLFHLRDFGTGLDFCTRRATDRANSYTINGYGPQPLVGMQHTQLLTVFDGAVNTFYIDGEPSAAVASTESFGSPGKVWFGYQPDPSFGWKGPIVEVVLTKVAPTLTQRRQMQQWQMRHWTNIVVALGDSLVHAGPGTGYLYKAIPLLGSDFYIVNRAVGGTSFDSNNGTGHEGHVNYLPGPGLDDTQGGVQRVALDWIPDSKFGQKYIGYISYTNNMGASWTEQPPVGPGTTTGYTDLLGDAAANLLANGYDAVTTSTILSRTDGMWDDSTRHAVNNILKGVGWAAAHDFAGIAPFADEPDMGVDAAPTVDSGDFSDNVHYNATGGAKLAPLWATTIQDVAASIQ